MIIIEVVMRSARILKRPGVSYTVILFDRLREQLY